MTNAYPHAANPYRRTLLRQERSVNTRRAIMRSAAALWAEKGYSQTTVEDVCAAAGVGRSTYYLHFESKDQLLTEFALATANAVSADVDEAVRRGSFKDELEAFVEGLVSRMEHTPRSLAVTIMRQVALNSVAARESGRDQILFDDVLTRIVRDGQQQGSIRPDVVPEEVGEIMSGMVLDALQRWAADDTDRTLRSSLDLRIALVLRGIALVTGQPAR
jgi:TetR/AcrR family transcriptional regulator, cholesterol catabolism regulator